MHTMYNNSFFCGAWGNEDNAQECSWALWREFRERENSESGCWKSIAFPILAPHSQKAWGNLNNGGWSRFIFILKEWHRYAGSYCGSPSCSCLSGQEYEEVSQGKKSLPYHPLYCVTCPDVRVLGNQGEEVLERFKSSGKKAKIMHTNKQTKGRKWCQEFPKLAWGKHTMEFSFKMNVSCWQTQNSWDPSNYLENSALSEAEEEWRGHRLLEVGTWIWILVLPYLFDM